MLHRCKLFLLIVLLFKPHFCQAATPQVPDRPDLPVVDLAEVLNMQLEKQLTTVLGELEARTGDRFVILTLRSLDGENIDDLSQRVARLWFSEHVGDNGSLLLIMSLQEELYHFERSKELEEVLSDSRLVAIGQETLHPLFNKGKYGAAITAASSEILKVLQDHNGINLAGSEKLAKIAGNAGNQFPWQIVFILMMIYVVLRKRGRKKE